MATKGKKYFYRRAPDGVMRAINATTTANLMTTIHGNPVADNHEATKADLHGLPRG